MAFCTQQEVSSRELLEAQTHIIALTLSHINSLSIKTAIELGIFEAIHHHGKPMSVAELATAIGAKPEKAHGLDCLVRILVRSGFLSRFPQEEDEITGYTLTLSSRLLLQDETNNVLSFVLSHTGPRTNKVWDNLGKWLVNEDATAYQTAHGRSLYEHVASDPELASRFNELMAGDSRLLANALTKECHLFGGLTSLVDVGGGTGTIARSIAQAFPHLKCTVFDLPHVVAGLQTSENLNFVGGDMFDSLPSANAILLKWVLHNWNDQDCVTILNKCRDAIPSKDEGGKVIVIDAVMNSQKENNEVTDVHLLWDMTMSVVLATKERNEKQWAKIFSDAGFTGYKIVSELGFKSLIEVYP